MSLPGCARKTKHEPAGDDGLHNLPRLEVVQPERSRLPVRTEVSALVDAMERADLCARVPGVVESLRLDERQPEVDIGRRVRAGEPLVKLAVPDLEADKKLKEALVDQGQKQKLQAVEAKKVAAKELEEAKREEKRYEAEFKRSQEKHDRTRKLAERGAVQPELVEETRSGLEAADAAWKAAQAKIQTKQARFDAADSDIEVADSRIRAAAAEVKRLEVLVDYAIIRAPFDGIVTNRWVNRGDMIKDAGAALVRVMRTDMVRVILDISERDVPMLNATEQNPNPDGKGDPAVVQFPALPGMQFQGYVTRLASALDMTFRTMRAEVHLENKDGLLRPGMHGTATVTLEERTYALTIPSTALVRRANHVAVFYVADPVGDPPSGVVRPIEVELGFDDGQRVEIRSGLSGKELIVAKGNGVLREGDTVVAVPAQ